MIYAELSSSRTLATMLLMYGLFMFPVLWWIIQKVENFVKQRKLPSIVIVLGVAVLGSVAAWVLQLVEVHLFYVEKKVNFPIGLFEDEFWASVWYVLPTLLLAELQVWHEKVQGKQSLFYLTFIHLSGIVAVGYPLTKIDSMPLKLEHHAQVEQPTNVVLILADDLGYNDISINGNPLINTPHIDAIAQNGVNCKRAYASAPICAPSRAGLLTGRYQQRWGFEFLADPFDLSPRVRQATFERYGSELHRPSWFGRTSLQKRGIHPFAFTLGELLQSMDYATGVVGKWHLGVHPQFRPSNNGFDYHYGIYNAAALYAAIDDPDIVEARLDWSLADQLGWQVLNYNLYHNGDLVNADEHQYEYMTSLFARKSVEYIEEHKDESFFLYVPFTAPHTPFQAPKTYYDQLSHITNHHQRVYYAMILALDDAVGQIKDALERNGLLDNTLIIFSSDNGGATYTRACDNSPFKGGKMSHFEGGTVVPLLMQWGDNLPQNVNYTEAVSLLDIYPTVAAATHAGKASGKDGVNLLPFLEKMLPSDSTDALLSDRTADRVAFPKLETFLKKTSPHDTLYWRSKYEKAVRIGNYKLHINEKENLRYLHDLSVDTSESINLYDRLPSKVQTMESAYAEWERDMLSPFWESNADVKIPLSTQEGSELLFFPW